MEGRSTAQIDFAKKLAEWGYVGFAVDLYGKGVGPQNRIMLQDRLLHVVEVVKGLREIESDRILFRSPMRSGLRTDRSRRARSR